MNLQELLAIIDGVSREGWKELDLSHKGLTWLPRKIGQITKLTTLDVSDNDLTYLPPDIGRLTNLTTLDLRGNQLTCLPPAIGQLTNLTNLDLRGNQLTSLPPEIGNLIKLISLDLRGNQLASFPPEIGQLVRLTLLNLAEEKLTSVPPEIWQLTNLTRLSLSDNELTSLPPEIGRLANLIELRLARNQLASMPSEIGRLTNLTDLTVSNNELTSIPSEIGQLSNLKSLYVSSNELISLPPEIGNLINLTRLNANGNKLTALPPEIGRLTNLTELGVRGNPLISPPPEVVKQGRQAILAYLRERDRKSEKQWVSKLLLVGEGDVGKTSVLHALRGEPFEDKQSTTRGIDIGCLELAHPSEPDVKMALNTWDFGGQEIYHATHQFFLTNRSLFLLVWDTRAGWEAGKLHYWLDALEARAPDSPVIIVASHTDERPASIPIEELKRHYKNIVGYCEVSNLTRDGIPELRERIRRIAADLPLMGEEWPATWMEAAKDVRSREEKHVTAKTLQAVLTGRGVRKHDVPIVGQLLHDLGDILYYQDDEELHDTVILDPQWVIRHISDVLDDPEIKTGLGIFEREHMERIWSGIKEPHMRDRFLRLMERYDLSYRTLEDRDISIVVERLSEDAPDYSEMWEAKAGQGEVSMTFKLNTIPAGIPTWFIARTHRFTTYTHWRYGAVFADEKDRKHLALVRALPHQRCVQLTVRGPQPHNFFTLLRDGFELTLQRFPGLKVQRVIPCRHNGAPCEHEFDFAHLQNAVERRPAIPDVQCPVAFEMVSVSDLVYGIEWDTPNAFDAQLVRIDRNTTANLKETRALRADMSELFELVQRQFTQLFRLEQDKMETHCPNVFVLRPVSGGWLDLLKRQKMELQLFCQQPGCWHPAPAGTPYTILATPQWLVTIAPYVRGLVKAMKYAAPLVGPWLGMTLPEDYDKVFKYDIDMMNELVKKLPDIEARMDDLALEHIADRSDPRSAYGSELRAVRTLLDKADPNQHWGGLRKVVTPEGHILWLCDYHAAQYAL